MIEREMIPVKFRRKLLEVLVLVILVWLKSSNSLVSIDKNDKLDLLIVENLSIISNKDFKDDGNNHKEMGEQLCAVKEILISNNIIIQKLCELEAKLDKVKSHPLSTYTGETRLHNVSSYDGMEELYQRHPSSSYSNPVMSKCIDKKKGFNEEESLNSYRQKLNRHLISKFDEKMKGFRLGKGDSIYSDKNENSGHKERYFPSHLCMGKQRAVELDDEESLTIKKDMKEEDHDPSMYYTELARPSSHKQHSDHHQKDIIVIS